MSIKGGVGNPQPAPPLIKQIFQVSRRGYEIPASAVLESSKRPDFLLFLPAAKKRRE
jgi:hypothetical protein